MQFSPHSHGENLYVHLMGPNTARNPKRVLGRVNLLSSVCFPFVRLRKVSRDTANAPGSRGWQQPLGANTPGWSTSSVWVCVGVSKFIAEPTEILQTAVWALLCAGKEQGMPREESYLWFPRMGVALPSCLEGSLCQGDAGSMGFCSLLFRYNKLSLEKCI